MSLFEILLPGLSAGEFSLGTGASYARRPRIREDYRRYGLALSEHLVREIADLPLGAVAASQREEVDQFPCVHGDRDVRGTAVGKDVSRILRRDLLNQFVVSPHQHPLFLFVRLWLLLDALCLQEPLCRNL